MPRKSRKGGVAQQTTSDAFGMTSTTSTAPKERVWNCAVYARLSVEDSGRKGADTIETQIELVASYVAQRSDLSLAGTYIDNGASGKDFDRPAWLRLMDDIKAGRVDCIAVKDLSRFSRNYIETCEFLEKILPFMGVRFVSVNDGYDSSATGSHNEGLIIALKALVHDQHIKDISRKIHASFEVRRGRGEYTRGYAPFGYWKVARQKGKLEPDPDIAPIVQQIFEWRASGMSYQGICTKLDEMGVLTPNEYVRRRLREANGLDAEQPSASDAFTGGYFKSTIWRTQTLKGILSNVAYIGSLQQRTQVQKLYANQPMKEIPREDWLITENAHEPIICRELFDKVQNINTSTTKAYEKSGKRPKRTENIFKGFPICGVCGSKMSRVYSEKKMLHTDPWVRYYFSCPIGRQHNSAEDEASRAFRSIREEVLIDAVFPLVAEELRKASNLAAIIEKRAKNQTNPRALLDKEIARTSSELNTINQRIGKLYEDYVDKLLDEREYVAIKAMYEGRAEAFRRSIGSLSERAAVVSDLSTDPTSSTNRWLKAARDFKNPDKLTREMLEAIVGRIIIFSPEKVEVVWKFGDELALLESMAGTGAEKVEYAEGGGSDDDIKKCA